MNVVYTQKFCPLCDKLKDALKAKNIEFVEETNIETMLSLGITKTPMMHVDDLPQLLNFKDALNWLNEKK